MREGPGEVLALVCSAAVRSAFLMVHSLGLYC